MLIGFWVLNRTCITGENPTWFFWVILFTYCCIIFAIVLLRSLTSLTCHRLGRASIRMPTGLCECDMSVNISGPQFLLVFGWNDVVIKWSMKVVFFWTTPSLIFGYGRSKQQVTMTPLIYVYTCLNFRDLLCRQLPPPWQNIWLKIGSLFGSRFRDFSPRLLDSVTFGPVMRQNITTETHGRGSLFMPSEERETERQRN